VGELEIRINALEIVSATSLENLSSSVTPVQAPIESAFGNDHSPAAMALAGHLAFWFGLDISRVDVMFRRSALMRAK